MHISAVYSGNIRVLYLKKKMQYKVQCRVKISDIVIEFGHCKYCLKAMLNETSWQKYNY